MIVEFLQLIKLKLYLNVILKGIIVLDLQLIYLRKPDRDITFIAILIINWVFPYWLIPKQVLLISKIIILTIALRVSAEIYLVFQFGRIFVYFSVSYDFPFFFSDILQNISIFLYLFFIIALYTAGNSIFFILYTVVGFIRFQYLRDTPCRLQGPLLIQFIILILIFWRF